MLYTAQEVQLLDCCTSLHSVLLVSVVNKTTAMLRAVSAKTDNTPCGPGVLPFLLSLQTPPVMLQAIREIKPVGP